MKTILALIGKDELSEEVLKKSMAFALNFEAKIIFVHTIHIPFLHLPSYNHEVPLDKKKIKEGIEEKMQLLCGNHKIDYYALVYFGDATERAIIEAKRDAVDLIISTNDIKIEKFVSEVQKPLLILKNKEQTYADILISTDLSNRSKSAINYIKKHFSQSKISLLYAYESIVMMTSMYDIAYVNMLEYQDENREISERLFEEFKADIELEGDFIEATSSITDNLLLHIEAKHPSLLVVASGDSEGFGFGSVSAYIARESSCDVLVYC